MRVDGLKSPVASVKAAKVFSFRALPSPTWRLTSASMINVRAAGRVAEIMAERAQRMSSSSWRHQGETELRVFTSGEQKLLGIVNAAPIKYSYCVCHLVLQLHASAPRGPIAFLWHRRRRCGFENDIGTKKTKNNKNTKNRCSCLPEICKC